MVYGYKLSHSKQKSKGWLWYKNIAHCTSLILQFNQASRERIFYWLCEINNLKKNSHFLSEYGLKLTYVRMELSQIEESFQQLCIRRWNITFLSLFNFFSNYSFFISRPSSVVDAQLKYTNTTTIIYLSIYHY